MQTLSQQIINLIAQGKKIEARLLADKYIKESKFTFDFVCKLPQKNPIVISWNDKINNGSCWLKN